jgi:hypothetical protein
MKNIIMILVAIAFLSSCATQRRCDKKFPPSTRDSVVIKDSIVIKEKDSVVISYHDSTIIKEGVSGEDSIPCNENVKTKIVRGGDTFIIEVKDGKINFKYNLEGTISRFSKTEVDRSKIKETTKEKSKAEVHEKTIVRVQQYIPLWVKILAWIGALAILYVIVKLSSRKIFALLL